MPTKSNTIDNISNTITFFLVISFNIDINSKTRPTPKNIGAIESINCNDIPNLFKNS